MTGRVAPRVSSEVVGAASVAGASRTGIPFVCVLWLTALASSEYQQGTPFLTAPDC